MIIAILRIFALVIILPSSQSYTKNALNKYNINRMNQIRLNLFASFFNKKPSPSSTNSILNDENTNEKIIDELRSKLFQEIDDYQSGSVSTYTAHSSNINSIVSKLPVSSTVDSSSESFFTDTNKYQLDYLSTAADDNESDNTNVNDKIWKLALKLAKVTKEIDIKNPSTFYITMKFTDICVIRYVYKSNNNNSNSNNNILSTKSSNTIDMKSLSSIHQIKYLEFQWFVFGRLTYNRLINRNEMWTILFRDNDSILFDISNTPNSSSSNSNDEEDIKEYDRKVLFRRS